MPVIEKVLVWTELLSSLFIWVSLRREQVCSKHSVGRSGFPKVIFVDQPCTTSYKLAAILITRTRPLRLNQSATFSSSSISSWSAARDPDSSVVTMHRMRGQRSNSTTIAPTSRALRDSIEPETPLGTVALYDHRILVAPSRETDRLRQPATSAPSAHYSADETEPSNAVTIAGMSEHEQAETPLQQGINALNFSRILQKRLRRRTTIVFANRDIVVRWAEDAAGAEPLGDSSLVDPTSIGLAVTTDHIHLQRRPKLVVVTATNHDKR